MSLFDRVLTMEDVIPAIKLTTLNLNAEKLLEEELMVTPVEVFNGYINDLPQGLVEYSSWVQRLVAEIPEEYRDSATFYPYGKFVKEGDDGYDDDMEEYTKLSYIQVTYKRPTTDEELLTFLQEKVAFHKTKLDMAERAAKYAEGKR